MIASARSRAEARFKTALNNKRVPADTQSEDRCICDGARFDPEQRHPFLVHPDCPRHASRPAPPEDVAAVTDEMVVVAAKHIAENVADWTDFEDGEHSHDLECTNWTAYTDDARTLLVAALAARPLPETEEWEYARRNREGYAGLPDANLGEARQRASKHQEVVRRRPDPRGGREVSTYWYFECMAHTPPLRSDDEFTQHTDDSAFKRGVELALNRADIESPWARDPNEVSDHFERLARRFLVQHPECPLELVNEYGDRRPLSPDGSAD